jgi:dipeptidyl aminopeptidase/acylaminoacyl peptidase
MRLSLLSAALGVLLLPVLAPSQQTSPSGAARPLQLDDYFRLESVESARISPDGRWIAFVRSRPVEEENRALGGVWMVAADGSSEPVRLTSPSFAASAPAWSPDGKLLAFSSSRPTRGEPRQGGASTWFLRMDAPSGEAFRIEGVEGTPLFSPDNRWIAFTRAVPPGPKPERTHASDFERKIEERFDGRAYDWMNYRFDRRGYLPDPRDPHATPPEELFVAPREGGAPRQLTRLGFDARDAAWRSDGGALAFVADAHQRDEHTYERADLWVVDLEGETRRLTDDGYHYSSPAWSPDGRWIAVRRQQGLDMVLASGQKRGSPVDLYLFPASGGEPRNLTADWDLEPGAAVWGPDGAFLFFEADAGGDTHVFRLRVSDGRVEQLTRGARRLGSFSFSRDFRRLAFTASDPTRPGNVFVAAGDGGGERRLTDVNREVLAGLRLSAPERVEFPSADGTRVEGWVMRPVAGTAGERHPMILTIHGGPHGAYGNDFSFERQLYAGRGYLVFYANPRGSTAYGEDFKWAIWGGWGDRDFQDLMAGVDHVLARYPVDPQRMGVTGSSYGGFMTNWIITQTGRFAAAAARASISNWLSDYGTADIPRTKESEFGGTPWEPAAREALLRWSPLVHAAGVSTPTLFLHGELDHRVPIPEAEQMYLALKKQRVPARFVRYPESYHGGWTPWRQLHSWKTLLEWWEEWLKPGYTATPSGK